VRACGRGALRVRRAACGVVPTAGGASFVRRAVWGWGVRAVM
jgi:hypothetical protein